MDVLIAGAGVGGLALARGLLAAGHRVRVWEEAPGLRRGGAAVTIFNNGNAVLGSLGLSLADIGGRIDELRSYASWGRPIARVDLGVLRRGTGYPVITISRERLIDRLADGLPADLIDFDTPVSAVKVDGDRVTAVAADGREHRPDVLVGADGYRSAVRRAVLADAPATDAGWATRQGLTAVLPELTGGTTNMLVVGDAGLVGMMPAGGGLLQWWFDTPWSRDDPEPESAADWLRARFAAYRDPVPALLERITDADLGLYPHVVTGVPDEWGRGPVTLVGDAIHAFPPTQAQGANQALEDAWLLARALSLPGDPAGLLRRYERRRTPRVRLVSRMAAAETTDKLPAFPVRQLTRLLPPRLAGRAYLSLIRRFSSVLNDERP